MIVVNEELRKEIATVLDSLKSNLGERLVAVILFGSRARGDATEKSDWDLLVIAKNLPQKHFERTLMLKSMLPPEWRGSVSLLARTPEELEDHISSLLLDIALDGQILYDANGWATNWLKSLREFIRREGLVRERTEAGDFWFSTISAR